MERDNATWTADLRDVGDRQQAALADLRRALVTGLLKALRGKADADAFFEDMAQEAVLKVLDKLDTFRGESKFTSWAMTIAVRTAITELRRRRWSEVSLDQMASGDDVAKPLEPADIEAGPEQKTERKAILSALDEAIRDSLTDRQRQTLLAELGGMPQEEIARRSGSNRNAIYKMMHDARKRLKTSLKSGGYSSVDIRVAFDF
ncbi:MAG: sigma-70 family RNA polymerase sigma factor [Planctomycetota bacterium]